MKKLILIGRSECGKTSLTQAIKGESIEFKKTQAVDYSDITIDTPGEYAENKSLASALALYAYESDIVGLVLSATEPYSLYSPCITNMANREVIGIVTKIDKENANPDRAEKWLRLAGCKNVFKVSSVTKEGVSDLVKHISQPKINKTKEKSNKNTENC